MGITQSTPQYNATRRIKWLFFVFVVATIGCIAAWFAVANTIESRVDTAIQQHRQAGGDARCDNRVVRGFPFRFGVFCDATAFSQGDVAIELGAIRSAAQFYSPNHIIVEADGPLTMRLADTTATLTWQAARTSIVRADPLPRRAALEIRQPRLQWATLPPLTAQAVTAYMRTLYEADGRGGAIGDVDIAAQIAQPDLTFLMPDSANAVDSPALALTVDVDATLKQATQRLQAGERQTLLANANVTLHRAALTLDDDSGALADGTLSTDALGRLSGTIDVRLVNVDAVMAALAAAFPDSQAVISLLGSLPRSGAAGDETALTLTINQGQVSFGIFPLGTLPPLL